MQTVFGPCQSSGLWQLACVVTVQAPVAGLQQAPFGCGHGLGEQTVFGPCQTFGLWQSACVVTVQIPVRGSQQAPVGCGQGFGAQTVFGPIQVPGHPLWMVTVQLPVAGSQQAPVGCVQGLGLQTVFGPNQTFGLWQAGWVVTMQTPVVGLQQAPSGWAHGLGEQTVYGPSHEFGGGQSVGMVTVQAPVVGSQQAPFGGTAAIAAPARKAEKMTKARARPRALIILSANESRLDVFMTAPSGEQASSAECLSEDRLSRGPLYMNLRQGIITPFTPRTTFLLRRIRLPNFDGRDEVGAPETSLLLLTVSDRIFQEGLVGNWLR